jgi:hypothetical protein
MQPRAYAITLSACALSLFVAVAGTNFVIDPMGVLGTRLLPRTLNSNDRYARLADFQSAPDRFDGLIFGSSRSKVISRDELTRRFGGVNFANFSVNAGMPSDHLPALAYVLHEKAAKGQRIRTVFVLLDPDTFGRRPFTNQSLEYATPPASSGENPVRFWWRNLMAIQFGVWRSAVWEMLGRPVAGPSAGPPTENAPRTVAASERPAAANAQPATSAPAPAAPVGEKVTDRQLYPQYLELWRSFVTLCRENDIQLIAAIAPISQRVASEYDPADLARAIDDLSHVAPVWDFTNDSRVARGPQFWTDILHFTPEVGKMMLERIFGDPVPPEWKDFGRLR